MTLIIGNEASDLDSIASSISYAYFLQKLNNSNCFVPVMNIPKEDFKLRTETTWFFKKLDIDYTLLLFWPEIKEQNLKNFNLILTDHNTLSSSQQEYSSNILEIIDHHEDDGKYEPKIRIIEKVGSVSCKHENLWRNLYFLFRFVHLLEKRF